MSNKVPNWVAGCFYPPVPTPPGMRVLDIVEVSTN